MIDHATGVVIGETAVVGDDVSMLHGVTLGGTGKQNEDRHPKIGRGVLLSVGAKVLGNIQIGEYSRVGAGSVVLKPVPPYTTVAGVPARVIGKAGSPRPSQDMNHDFPEEGHAIILLPDFAFGKFCPVNRRIRRTCFDPQRNLASGKISAQSVPSRHHHSAGTAAKGLRRNPCRRRVHWLIYRNEEDGDISYDFNMSILEMDLPEPPATRR